MTATNERRLVWREYAIADLKSAGTVESATKSADKLLAAEDERFGGYDELRAARATEIEQRTRAENAEMALERARDDNMALCARIVASVPVAELREMADRWDADEDYRDADTIIELRALCDAAEQRAAAKPAEGGETGGGL